MEETLNLILGPLGALVLALFALIGNFRGWWVSGPTYRDVIAEKDEWKQAALRALSGAESAAAIAESLAQQKKDGK